MSTIRSQIAQLKKNPRLTKPMTWRRLIECDSLDQLPADQREKWRAFLEEKEAYLKRGRETLAAALTDLTGQAVTVEEAEAWMKGPLP